MDKDFGTREEGVEVQAGDLEPGVYVDGNPFDVHGKALLVQETKFSPTGNRVLVTALDQEAGRLHERLFSVNKLVETWGRI